MELGKYIRAMRPKKYLTREFKVYDASMADDNTIDTMSTDAPPMDNVMPYTDGLEDPRNRQLELADGGIVEREEFSEGTTPAYLKNIFEKAYQENNYNIDDLYEQAISKKNELYETTKKGSYKTPTTKKKILRSFKEYVSSQKAMSPEVYTKYIKERIQNPSLPHIEGWNKPLLGTPLEAEKIGKTKNVRVTNLRKAESMLSPEELKQWRDYTRSEQRKVKYQRKFQKSERFNPETGKFEYDPKIKQEALAKKYLTKNIRRAIRNESYEKLTPIEKNKYLDFEKRLNTMGTIIKENPKYLLDDKEVMNKLSTAVDPQTGEIYKKTPTFTDIKNRRIWEIEHIDPIVEGQTKGRGSFLRNLQVLPEPIHKNFKNNAESFLNKHYGDPKYQSQVDNIINEAKNLKVELRVRDVGRVGYKPQFTNFADKAEDIISTYVKNPKARQAYIQTTGTILKEEPVVAAKNFIDTLNPQEQSLVEKFGKQLNSGVPIDEIINSLPVREAQIVKNMGSKIASLSKLGLKGLQELTIGTGLPGIALTLGLQIPLTVYEASQGKSGSEMLNSATFGLLGKSENDILIEMGGEDAVKGLELEEKLNKLNDLKEQFKTADEEIRFTSLDDIATFNEDKIKEQILKRKNNIIKEYSDIANSIQENDLQYQKKLDEIRAAKLDREQARLDIGQMEAYNKPIDEIGISESGVFEEEINKAIAEQNAKEKTNPVNKKPYPNVMQGTVGEPVDNIINRNFAYAVGGRVGFKKGSKDKDSPVIPISPLTDLPQNESRRDFLKGIGAVGLGVAALGTGAFKLAKSLKTKEALSLLGKEAVGQPEWFAPLVDKIILKGIRLEKDGKKLDSYVLQEGDKTLTLNKNPYGTIEVDVQGGGAYDDTFTLRYNNSIGKNMYGEPTEFRDFKIIESRPKYQVSGMDESGFDYDLEPMEEYFSGKNLLKLEKNATGILSDVEGLEKIATGKIKDPKLAKTRAQVRDKLSKKPADDRIIENYDYEYDIDIPHEYND
jgi:hypothetical protein